MHGGFNVTRLIVLRGRRLGGRLTKGQYTAKVRARKTNGHESVMELNTFEKKNIVDVEDSPRQRSTTV